MPKDEICYVWDSNETKILWSKSRPNATVPKYANEFAAGFDLYASVFFGEDGNELKDDFYRVSVGESVSVGHGICTAIHPSKYVQASAGLVITLTRTRYS
jgi:dUTPase